jgi:hypothetical protein
MSNIKKQQGDWSKLKITLGTKSTVPEVSELFPHVPTRVIAPTGFLASYMLAVVNDKRISIDCKELFG